MVSALGLVRAADACVPGVLALDRTTGRGAGMTYVTIAVGRDYADIAPVSGTYVAPHSGVLTMSKRAVVRRVEGSPDTPMDSALSA